MNSKAAIDFILAKLADELPDNLRYHSVDHTKEVMDAAERIAAAEGIVGKDLELLLTAVAFHDSGFIVAYADHEKNSCKLVERYLPGYGYSADQIQMVQDLIMSTKVPQDARSHLGRILCDADLDYLGRDDYHAISSQLLEELELNGKPLSHAQWLDVQIGFLRDHHYWTTYAKENRADGKDRRLAELEAERAKLD